MMSHGVLICLSYIVTGILGVIVGAVAAILGYEQSLKDCFSAKK